MTLSVFHAGMKVAMKVKVVEVEGMAVGEGQEMSHQVSPEAEELPCLACLVACASPAARHSERKLTHASPLARLPWLIHAWVIVVCCL